MTRHDQFLHSVELYVQENPEVAAHVSDYVSRGLNAALSQTRERAADMEVALCVAIAKRWPKRESMILSKLKKWKDKASLNWEGTIESLEDLK